MASGSVPPAVKTIQQKIEHAWDEINRIFSMPRAVQLATLAEFMTIYSPSSTLVAFIDDLFQGVTETPRGKSPINGMEVKSHLFTELTNIMSRNRSDIAQYVLHKDGEEFEPKPLMCLFVCGLLRSISFEKWMKKDKENEKEYIREFLSIILYSRKIFVYSSSTNGVIALENNGRKIPDKLFLTSTIPDTAADVLIMDSFPNGDPWRTLSDGIRNGDIIVSDPVLWYAYVIQEPSTSQAWAVPSTKNPKCIGVLTKEYNRKYLFAYNLPKYDRETSPTDPKLLKGPFIEEAYLAYANVLQNFQLSVVTEFISKYTYENPMLLYIHVLLMGVYGENRKFYACNHTIDATMQSALLAGKTCEQYLNLMTHIPGSSTALTIQPSAMDEDVMELLAMAHLELMKVNPSFRYQTDLIDDQFNDMFNSSCPVKYDWVFENKTLTQSANWMSKITMEVGVKETDAKPIVDPYLGVLRRIIYFMRKAKRWDDKDPFLKTAEKFTKPVTMGAKVDNDSKKRIVSNLQKLGETKEIFNRGSKFDEFLSDHDEFKKPMREYFQGVWHPDDVFGKYIVHDASDDSYTVRDSFQMQIDNSNTEKQVERIERPPSAHSASSGISAVSYGHSSDDERSNRSTDTARTFPALPGTQPTNKKTDGKNGVDIIFPTVERLKHSLQPILESEARRYQGGLDKLCTDLDVLVDVEKLSDEERKDKAKEMKVEIATLKSGIEQHAKDLEGEIIELGKANKAAKDAEDRNLAEIKRLTAESRQHFLDLADAQQKELDLMKTISDQKDDIKKLTEEKDKIEDQVRALTAELDALKAEKTQDAEEIKKLRERVAELEAEIVKLQKEIDDGTETRKKLVASEASNQAEVDKLKAKEKELGEALAKQKQLEEEKAKLEKEMNRLNLLLTDDQAQLNEQILEKSKLMDEAKKLREEIVNYENQLKKIIEQVENATKENEKRMSERMWRIHKKVDETIQGELQESELLRLLRKEDYKGFTELVKTNGVVKKQFTLPALFLTYESIGATWRLIEDLPDKKDTTAFMAEKLIHDIRLFQTIQKHDEHIMENYTTKYFMKFLEAFDLITFDPESKRYDIIDIL